jgi:hypothetical protein
LREKECFGSIPSARDWTNGIFGILGKRKNDFYLLKTYIKPENKSNETTIINIFDQMLSTIKFID